MDPYQKKTSLVKASVLAFSIAVLVLVLFILPAEYNIDPTGVGKSLGLTVFTPLSEAIDAVPAPNNSNKKQDNVIITVPAGRGVEYKLNVEQFAKVTYEWTTSGTPLYVDLHGEPRGDTSGYFESYTIATVNKMNGSFTAPFAGSHGWYWKNNSAADVEIKLNFSGDYLVEGLK